MKKLVIALLFAVLLSGCGGKWVHPDKNDADFARDKWECDGIAQQRTINQGGRVPNNPLIWAMEMRNCLVFYKGWSIAK